MGECEGGGWGGNWDSVSDEDHRVRMELQRRRDEVIRLEQALKTQLKPPVNSSINSSELENKCMDLVNTIIKLENSTEVDIVSFKCWNCSTIAPCFTVVTYNKKLTAFLERRDPDICLFNVDKKANWKIIEIGDNNVH